MILTRNFTRIAAEDPRVIMQVMNEEAGVLIRVSHHVRGFSVTMQDVDSGEFFPEVKIFPTEEAARTYAESQAD